MWRYWILAFRPKTLSLAISPVLVGVALAWQEGGAVAWSIVAVTLLVATLIQIATNLHNDASDHERGADDAGTRLGPPRATAEGWLSARQVKMVSYVVFASAFGLGMYLVSVGGWPIFILGVLSIAAGLAYTGGPFPVAYSGLGEIFVWLFFGVAAVAGTYYLQTLLLSGSALLAGSILGLPAAAVLVVNNYRDLENDRKVGKKTLAVSLGRAGTRVEYALLMLLPFPLLSLLWLLGAGAMAVFFPLLMLPWAIHLVVRFWREQPGKVFNEILAGTARLQLGLAVLMGIGIVFEAT